MSRFGRQNWARVFFLCALILCVLASVAHAETPVPDGKDNIVPLGKGAPAPFSGQLFDNKTALRWGLWIKSYKELAAAEAEKAAGVCKADLAYRDDLLKIEQDKNHTVIADLKKRLLDTDAERVKLQDQLDHPPWYTSVWFGFGVGAISTTLVVVVAHQAF